MARGYNFRLSLALDFKHHASDRTILVGSTKSLKNTLLMFMIRPYLSSSSTNLTRGLAARRLFRISLCHEGAQHLQTAMPSPGFELRPFGNAFSSLTTILNGRHSLKYAV
ncbi:hypothetical protein TNCV_1838071 [Trichonephila clavipes]|nr:hypothetical protein TNCV_1838071 [Trichonephila clavipes]